MLPILLRQDSVDWHRPYYTTIIKDSNAVEVDLGRPITFAEQEAFYVEVVRATGSQEIAPVPHEQ